jgi:type VI secretion system protein ImpM
VIAPPAGSALNGAAVGFCGKLPARGDFVAVGLPRQFVEKWHDWMQCMLTASREALGEAWLTAWNVAPVWRFALSAGICGTNAVLGLWMPSVDRVGRQFPLTFAALALNVNIAALIRDGAGFLAVAEAAGLDCLAADLEPAEIAARLIGDYRGVSAAPGIAPEFQPCEGAMWWTEMGAFAGTGAVTLATPTLPDESVFLRMLRPGESVWEAGCPRPYP